MYFAGNASHVVDGIGVAGWYPVRICALLCTFAHLLRGLDDFSDGFAPGIGPLDDCLYCALLGKNGRQGWPGFLGVDVVCFVGS